MQVTVGSHQIINYQGGGSTATLKIRANDTFLTSNGTTVHRNYTTPATFYQSVSCTVAGTTVTVPSFTIDSTTDSNLPNGSYTSVLYDSNGLKKQAHFSGWRIPHAFGSSVTWVELATYNNQPASPIRFNYPTEEDVIRLIGEHSGGGSSVTLANTYGNSLTTAIDDIGSTPTTLVIDEDTTVTTHIVIPTTVMLEQRNLATITISGTGSIDFQGRGVRGDEIAFFAANNAPDFLWPNQGQVNLTTNVISYTAHGFTTGQQLIYTLFQYGDADGTPPISFGGVTDNTIYYAIRVDADTLKLATTYANALAGTAIDFTTAGHQTFLLHHTPLRWSGTAYPTTVSSELINTGNNSQQDRTNILTRALTGKGCWIEVYPRVIDKLVALADKHNIRFKTGLHVNTHDGTTGGWPYSPFSLQFVLGNDSELTSERGAIVQQSSVDYINGLASIRMRAENSVIHHNHFRQDRAATATGSAGPISIAGGVNNHILDNTCELLKCYTISINPAFPGVDDPRQCSARRNMVKDELTQVFFIGGGDEIDFSDNYLDVKDFQIDPVVACSPFDVEPNGNTILKNIRIEGNTFDTRGMNNAPGVIVSYIRVNPAGVEDPQNIFIKNNRFLVQYPTEVAPDGRYAAVDINGVDNFEVSGNQMEGIGPAAGNIEVRWSRRGRIFNNTSKNGAAGVRLKGTQDVEVFENRALPTPDYHFGTTTLGDVTEAATFDTYNHSSALQYWIGQYKTTSTLAFAPGTPGFGIDGGYIFRHFLQSTVYINEVAYTITGINNVDFSTYPTTEMTVSPNFSGTPTVHLTIPNTDISAATNIIHAVGHGYVTGAGIAYSTGVNSFSDVYGAVYGNLFVIRIDNDNFKLARSYEDTQTGTALDIVTVPVGNHEFYTTAVAFCSGNDFHDNDTNGSEIRMPTPHSTTLVRKGAVTIDPASVNGTTTSSQTFTLLGARVGDALTLNPPSALTAGLQISMPPFVSADDTVTIVFYNSTGAPINESSATWTYGLDR